MQAGVAHDALSMITYEGRPAALLVADSPAAVARASATAELAGCRILDTLQIEKAVQVLREPPAFRVLLAEFEGEEASRYDQLLDELLRAADGGKPVIIAAPPTLTEAVAARIWGRNIWQLCSPSDEEVMTTFSDALQETSARLGENGRTRLQQLSEEAARLADALASMSENVLTPQKDGNGREPPRGIDATYVRAIIRARRLREQFLPAHLFADPAWDMLLDLLAARLDGQRVAVSSLCIAAAVPATTALRHIKMLTEEGLFVRIADPSDGRRVYIELADETASALLDYLRTAQRMATPTI